MPKPGIGAFFLEGGDRSSDVLRYSLVDDHDVRFKVIPSDAKRITSGWAATVQDFTADPQNGLCVLVMWTKEDSLPEYEVKAFESDGRLDLTIDLGQLNFTPFRAARFKSGEVFLVGSETATNPAGTVRAAIFDGSGRLMARFVLADLFGKSQKKSESISAGISPQSADATGNDPVSPKDSEDYKAMVAFSNMALTSGDDGQLYIATQDGKIRSISRHGEATLVAAKIDAVALPLLLEEQGTLIGLDRQSTPRPSTTTGNSQPLAPFTAVTISYTQGGLSSRLSLPPDAGKIFLGVAQDHYYFLRSVRDEQTKKSTWMINELSSK